MKKEYTTASTIQYNLESQIFFEGFEDDKKQATYIEKLTEAIFKLPKPFQELIIEDKINITILNPEISEENSGYNNYGPEIRINTAPNTLARDLYHELGHHIFEEHFNRDIKLPKDGIRFPGEAERPNAHGLTSALKAELSSRGFQDPNKSLYSKGNKWTLLKKVLYNACFKEAGDFHSLEYHLSLYKEKDHNGNLPYLDETFAEHTAHYLYYAATQNLSPNKTNQKMMYHYPEFWPVYKNLMGTLFESKQIKPNTNNLVLTK